MAARNSPWEKLSKWLGVSCYLPLKEGKRGDTLAYLGPSGIHAPAGLTIPDYSYNVPQDAGSRDPTCSHLSHHTEGRGCDSQTLYSSHQEATQPMVVTPSRHYLWSHMSGSFKHRSHALVSYNLWFPYQEMTSHCLHMVRSWLGQTQSTEL